MYELSRCILDTSVKINISELLDNDPKSEAYINSVKNIIFNFQELGHFEEAHKFSQISGIVFEQMHINEWKLKLTQQPASLELWRKCIAALEAVPLGYESLRKFLHQFLDPCNINDISIHLTHAFIQAKDFSYATKLSCDAFIRYKIELNIWKTVIKIEQSLLTPDQLLIWSDIWMLILNACEDCINVQDSSCMWGQCKLDEDDSKTLIQVINKILDAEKIELASRVCTIFNHQCTDLAIINFCKWLTDCNVENKSLHQYRSVTKNFTKCQELEDIVLSSTDSDLSNPNVITEILKKCIMQVNFGKRVCEKIVLYYKLSSLINQDYETILKENDEIGLLKTLIEGSAQNPDLLTLAKELIVFEKINDDQIAQFILNEVWPTLESSSEIDSTQETNTNTSFLTLIRILYNPSILGKKFMDILKTEVSPQISVQVCIKAHECFTLASNVEGIALVLRTVRTLVTQHLAEKNDYSLMIQLLIGIGRYSEMSYIFNILKENHKFELILRKGNYKLNQLRVALLDYLKGDKEMYPLIALNFSMHREIAEMLESMALKTLKSLNFKKHQNLMCFKDELKRVLQEFIDAAESYKKADCYNRSDYCEKMAELVALQINFLPSSIVIINLGENTVSDFIAKHSKFYEVR